MSVSTVDDAATVGGGGLGQNELRAMAENSPSITPSLSVSVQAVEGMMSASVEVSASLALARLICHQKS